MSHLGWLLAFAVLAAGSAARADDGSSPSSQEFAQELAELRADHARALAELREASEQRMDELEREVARLGGHPQGASVDVASTMHDSPLAPKLTLRGFGHVQGDWARNVLRPSSSRETDTHFTNGGVDLFIASEISERASFLNETVYEFGQDGANSLDVERVMLKYEFSDALAIAAGRGHTALGYANQRLHHGSWMQVTTDRPTVYRFEDDGGILPVHFVGLELSGSTELGPGSLSYIANLANGRGSITDSVQLVEDRNDSKMMSLMLSYEPREGTGFGFSALRDEIPGDAALAALRAQPIGEMIFGAHFWTSFGPLELVAEQLFLTHDDHTSGTNFRHSGGYVQLGYRIGDFTPYYRYDFLNMQTGDPFYLGYAGGVATGPLAEIEDSDEHTIGVRYDLTSFLALKAELRALSAKSQRDRAGTIQASFAF